MTLYYECKVCHCPTPSIALAGNTNLYKFELDGNKTSTPHIILKACVKANDYKLHVIHNTNFV